MEILKRSRHLFPALRQKIPLRAICIRIALAIVFLAPLAGIDPGRAEERAPTENSIKLAYLYNFAKIIHWPHASIPSNEFVIGIVGNGSWPVASEKKEAGGKRIVVRHIQKLEQLKDCQLVFIPAAESHLLPQVLRMVEARPVVTVGDFDGFLKNGGMINLVSSKGKIIFDINVAATKKAGVTVGYQLLRLARELI